jgi:elongation factor 2
MHSVSLSDRGFMLICRLDATVGVAIGDIRDNLIVSFNEVALSGPLSGEALRGICFEVHDAKVHHDSAHRRADQICPMMKRACFAAILTAQPRYVEPVFAVCAMLFLRLTLISQVEIQAPDTVIGAVCRSLKKRRGEIQEDNTSDGSTLHAMRAFLPVSESFGFSAELLAETSGRAFPQCSFSHWQLVNDDPLSAGSRAATIVRESRQRKHMPPAIPPLDTYLDKL